jgi:hypothetical protein
MKTSATRAFRVEIVAMCTVGIISTRAKGAFNARHLNLALMALAREMDPLMAIAKTMVP